MQTVWKDIQNVRETIKGVYRVYTEEHRMTDEDKIEETAITLGEMAKAMNVETVDIDHMRKVLEQTMDDYARTYSKRNLIKGYLREVYKRMGW